MAISGNDIHEMQRSGERWNVEFYVVHFTCQVYYIGEYSDDIQVF